MIYFLFLLQSICTVNPSTCGVVDSSCKFTALSNTPTALTCEIKASSTEDPSKFDSAQVNITASPLPIVVEISPKTANLKPSESVQFNVTVKSGNPQPIGTVFHYLPGYPINCSSTIAASSYPPNYTGLNCVVDNEIPLAQFPVPPTGGTYVDANLGYRVRIISGAGDATHGYSTLLAESADSSFALIDQNGLSQAARVNLTTGAVLGVGPGRADIVRLSPTNSNEYYWVVGNTIKRYHIKENITDTAVNASQFQVICDGGDGNVVVDGWYGFWPNLSVNVCANVSSLSTKQICIGNVKDGRILCGTMPNDVLEMNAVTPAHGKSANGKHYVMVSATPSNVLFNINEATNQLDFITKVGIVAPHADVAHDVNGRQYYFLQMALEPNLIPSVVLLPLDAEAKMIEQKIILMELYKGGGVMPWPPAHYGCSPIKPICVKSTMYSIPPYRNPLDLTTIVTLPFTYRGNFLSEIIGMKLFGTGVEIRRFTINRSMQWTTDQYWSTPRATIGNRVIYTTNLGHPPPAPKKVVAIETGW